MAATEIGAVVVDVGFVVADDAAVERRREVLKILAHERLLLPRWEQKEPQIRLPNFEMDEKLYVATRREACNQTVTLHPQQVPPVLLVSVALHCCSHWTAHSGW